MLLRLVFLLPLAALAACVPRAVTPPPQPAPQPVIVTRPPPAQLPPPQAPVIDWTDAPLSAGAWRYAPAGGVASASFGSALTVRCEPTRSVTLLRSGAASGNMTLRTSSESRTLPARSEGGGLAASLPAADPLLDALAFSRGRFAVETTGTPTLIIPAWPELARVVEDCRR